MEFFFNSLFGTGENVKGIRCTEREAEINKLSSIFRYLVSKVKIQDNRPRIEHKTDFIGNFQFSVICFHPVVIVNLP